MIENAPPGEDQRIHLSVLRISYTPSAIANAPELWDNPSRFRLYTVLTGAVEAGTSDTISGAPADHYRVTPQSSIRATGAVRWRGAGQISAGWTDCTGLGPDYPPPGPPGPLLPGPLPSGAILAPIGPGTPLAAPYQEHASTSVADLAAGECHLFRIQKVDLATEYTLAIVSVTYPAP